MIHDRVNGVLRRHLVRQWRRCCFRWAEHAVDLRCVEGGLGNRSRLHLRWRHVLMWGTTCRTSSDCVNSFTNHVSCTVCRLAHYVAYH